MSSFRDIQIKYPDMTYRIGDDLRGWFSLSAAPLATEYFITIDKINLVMVTPYVPISFPCRRLYVDMYCVGQYCSNSGNIVEAYRWEYRLGERDGVPQELIQRIGMHLQSFRNIPLIQTMIKLKDPYPKNEIKPEDIWACTIEVALPKILVPGAVTIYWRRKDILDTIKIVCIGFYDGDEERKMVPTSSWERDLYEKDAPEFVVNEARKFFLRKTGCVNTAGEEYDD